MNYYRNNASPGTRTNGSPVSQHFELWNNYPRRDGVNCRATEAHARPIVPRGRAAPPARRLRSEPVTQDGAAMYDPGFSSSTRLSPTAADWVPKLPRAAAAATPSPGARRPQRSSLLSYADVAKISDGKPLQLLRPPPPCPILARSSEGDGKGDGKAAVERAPCPAARRPAAAQTDSTDGAKTGMNRHGPPSKKRSVLERQESTDGGALLTDSDTPTVFSDAGSGDTRVTSSDGQGESDQVIADGESVANTRERSSSSSSSSRRSSRRRSDSPIRSRLVHKDGLSSVLGKPTIFAGGLKPDTYMAPWPSSSEFREVMLTDNKLPRPRWPVVGSVTGRPGLGDGLDQVMAERRGSEIIPDRWHWDASAPASSSRMAVEIKPEETHGPLQSLVEFIDNPDAW